MRVVISGGGTGGHLFPALTIALYLKNKGYDVLYIGAKRRIEEKVVPKCGIEFMAIDVIGLGKSIFDKFRFMTKQVKAIKEIKSILKEFKPNVVVGWGGYASFATLTAANMLKIPTIIHEQNAVMGRANKLLTYKADKVLTCFPKVHAKEIVVGNPRASEAFKLKMKPRNRIKKVLFVMGSQGSSTVNKIISDYLDIRNNHYLVSIICGKGHIDIYKGANLDGVELIEFTNKSLQLFAESDLVVTRGGATTLAELSALGKPLIIIPSPYVYKNHQYYNALYYKKNKAAIILKEDDLTSEKLRESIEEIINFNFKRELMSNNSENCAFVDANEKILKIIDSYR